MPKGRDKDILTTGDIARILGCAPRTAAALVDSAEIPGWRVGGHRRALSRDVDEYCRRKGIRDRRTGRALVCVTLPTMADALRQIFGDRLREASGIGYAGMLIERLTPAWLVVDLGVCDGNEAAMLATAAKSLAVRTAVILPEGESLRTLGWADVVVEAGVAAAVLAGEVMR